MVLSLLRFLAVVSTFFACATQINAAPLQHRHLEQGTKLEWPALRFHFTIKQDDKKVYNQNSFDMYANPVVMDNNRNVLYDVYATFTEAKALHNYTLVDGIAYSEATPFSTGSSSGAPTPLVVCLDTESGKLPAINSIVAAVNEATAVSDNGTVTVQCQTGGSYETAVNGIDYTVCVSGTTGFTMQGSDMDVSVEYLESQIAIVAPTPDAEVGRECQEMGLSSSVSPIGHALLTGEPMPSRRKRQAKTGLK